MVKNESGHYAECLDSHFSVIGLRKKLAIFPSLYRLRKFPKNGQIFYVTNLGLVKGIMLNV